MKLLKLLITIIIFSLFVWFAHRPSAKITRVKVEYEGDQTHRIFTGEKVNAYQGDTEYKAWYDGNKLRIEERGQK